ncbi:hypothetical protein PHMEG_00031853 [Phytophthora megakarya]|uniref:Uncharacterized protein n=1 Tax=Phytophthora megakarya TaxID=4795 RepID=A0A225UX36_9STRA|nr:hypothetical protein PHMEG_00031853 [Phytophthora megakarya]
MKKRTVVMTKKVGFRQKRKLQALMTVVLDQETKGATTLKIQCHFHKTAVPLWFRGFKSRFKTWDQFHDAFHAFQSETYQRFTTRSTTSVLIRNKQIVTSSKARKRAGKKPRKDVTLIPEED